MKRDELRILASSAFGWAEAALVVFRENETKPPAALTKLHELAKAVCDQPASWDAPEKEVVAKGDLDQAVARADATEKYADAMRQELSLVEGAYAELVNNLRLVLDGASLKTLAEPGLSDLSPGKGPNATADAAANANPEPVAPAGFVPQASVAPVAGAADGLIGRKHGLVLQHKDGHKIVLVEDGPKWWARTVAGDTHFTLGPLTALLDETKYSQSEWCERPSITKQLALPPFAATTPPLRRSFLQLKEPADGPRLQGMSYDPFEVDIYSDGPLAFAAKKVGSTNPPGDYPKANWREVTSDGRAPGGGHTVTVEHEANRMAREALEREQPKPGKKPIVSWEPDNATLIDCLSKATSQVEVGKRLVKYAEGITVDQGRELLAAWKAAKPKLELDSPENAFPHVVAKLIQGKAL